MMDVRSFSVVFALAAVVMWRRIWLVAASKLPHGRMGFINTDGTVALKRSTSFVQLDTLHTLAIVSRKDAMYWPMRSSLAFATAFTTSAFHVVTRTFSSVPLPGLYVGIHDAGGGCKIRRASSQRVLKPSFCSGVASRFTVSNVHGRASPRCCA